ncbi:MAG: ammonia-dependent NAD(+) synthetase [Burkholderiaceae bacterium]
MSTEPTGEQRDEIQRQIISRLQVAPGFDAAMEIERRTAFLCERLTHAVRRTLVLGISGGVDSLLAGCLAQNAVQRLRDRGYEATFIAMRLPYGTQKDEDEAQQSLAVIKPDRTMTVNVKASADALMAAVEQGGQTFRDAAARDFVFGNIKARQRMVIQYAVAGGADGLVIGTDHAAEALTGFFTKFGDGACDVAPLTGLTKRRVRRLAQVFGAPEELAMKVPTADLEDLAPLKPDEEALGIRYDDIDDFLEGKSVSDAVWDRIVRQYRATAHKRSLPYTPQDDPNDFGGATSE